MRIIVPTSPGGGVDKLARSLQEFLSKKDVPALVLNLRGATGLMGTKELLKNKPCDFMIGTPGPLVINQMIPGNATTEEMMSKLKPVAFLASSPLILAVNTKNTKVKNIDEFIAKLKKDNLKYASLGMYSGPHLAAVAIEQNLKLRPNLHIPYNEASKARTDFLRGEFDFLFDRPSGLPTLLLSSDITILGTTGKTGIPINGRIIKTLAETTLMKDFPSESFFGLVTHSETKEVIKNQMEAVTKCLVTQQTSI